MKPFSTPLWRFGPFEADATEHQLRRDGKIVAVTRKSFALLATLLSRPGKLFTKAELFETVWAGTVVTDAALSRAIRELRVALGDDAGAPRFIATVHGVGFRFVAPVGPDVGALSRPEPLASPSTLVGRGGELAVLDAALADARAGRRGLVFVTGEAGIGKTAVVESFLEPLSASTDTWIATGRCIEQYGTSDAYLPVLEAIETLTRQVGATPLREVLARYAPSWLALLPWLSEGGSPTPRRTDEASAHGMLREIAHALDMLAAQRPIVIWLEDLHWSDPSSLDVVSFLAGRREPARVLIVATFRPVYARAAESPLNRLALRLCQHGQAQELALGLLGPASIVELLRQRFGDEAMLDIDQLGAFLHRRTEGNALFVVSIVDDLVRRGALRLDAGVWSLQSSIAGLGDALPDTLRQLVHEQLEGLAPADRRLVEAAAVVGADFCGAALAAALELETSATEDRCAALAEQGRFFRVRTPVAWPDGTVSAGFGFLHALYQHGAHERVTQSRHAEWQARIGLREEKAHATDRAPIAAELALRFEAAGDLERTLRYLMLAGSAALARAAYRESIDHYRRLLALLPRVAPERRPRDELDALLPLGAALMATEGYASAEVEATYRRALEIGRGVAAPGEITRIRRGLWNVLFSRDERVQARAAAEELLALAEDEAAVFDALSKLGHTCLHSGDFADARRHLERALAMAEGMGAGAARETPRLLAYLSWASWYLGEPDGALHSSEASLAAAARDPRPHNRLLVLGHKSFVHLLRGEMADARAMATEQCALGEEQDLPYWVVWGRFLIDCVDALRGDFDRGAAAMRAGIEQMRGLGTMVGVTSWMYLLAEVELAAGRPQAARAVLAASPDRIAANSRARNAAETARIEGHVALAEVGRPADRAEAIRCFEAALAIARSQGARSLALRALCDLVRFAREPAEKTRALTSLREVYAGFSEGRETADLRQAAALLAAAGPDARDLRATGGREETAATAAVATQSPKTGQGKAKL